jgi:hypothetical protein
VAVPEFGDHPDWSTVIRTEYVIDAGWQEMAENAVDSAHFRFVHNTATVPDMESYEIGFPDAVSKSSQKFPTPRGVMEGRIDNQQMGPGLAVVSFSGIVDTMNLACTTPISADRCIVRFNFRFKTMGDEGTTANVGKAFVAEVEAGARRHGRPVHEVPQVGRPVLRRAGAGRAGRLPSPVLARPPRRRPRQGDRIGPPARRIGVT